MTFLTACLRVLSWAQLRRLTDAGLRRRLGRALTSRFSPRERAALQVVERYRDALAGDSAHVAVRDYGAGSRMVTDRALLLKPEVRVISEIFRSATVPVSWGRFLFRLVRALRPARVLELGTSLGVSAAYLRAALDLNAADGNPADGGPAGLLVTIEGAPALAERARRGLESLDLGPVRVVEGSFAERLPDVLPAFGPFDAVFLDGHHEADAVLGYVELILPHLAPGGWILFDDIVPWTRTVRRAWRCIRAEHPLASCVDFVKMGLYVHPPNPKKSGPTQ